MSGINKEVLVFSIISIIQAELNELMRIRNCHHIRKFTAAPPAEAGFLKNGDNVTVRYIKIAEEIIGIHLYFTHIDEVIDRINRIIELIP